LARKNIQFLKKMAAYYKKLGCGKKRGKCEKFGRANIIKCQVFKILKIIVLLSNIIAWKFFKKFKD